MNEKQKEGWARILDNLATAGLLALVAFLFGRLTLVPAEAALLELSIPLTLWWSFEIRGTYD